ncbi:Molybdenum cofactor biosynthesis enzyme [Desulfitobacterium sp. LBE]|uniref:glycosyltransferase n=1 Tax=Desulfitobacterium sp. LBE TaxID=884086 RepID=UPI00119B6A7D|nr:glycosyltransferase [Desulfitobacterium sp. LBE]TWH60038.1 Molybdenum cofactor biosynthesis enzyme [Desulfitobacterium sp. LBE]
MNDESLERVCFPVTLRCNLRCKLCAERSPYYEKPYHPTFDELTVQIDRLFSLTEHVGKLDITGGEPFLRKDLSYFIHYIFDKHRDKIDKLRVTTNGTILPTNEFIEAAMLWGNSFYVIVDNYHVSAKSKDVCRLFKEAGVPFELRDYSGDLHCDGWVDYGDFSRKHSNTEARQLFHKCMVPKLGFFTCMVGGLVFPCAKARLLYEKGIASVYMDAFDPELTETGKRARLKALLGDEVIEACKYCNGLCEKSPRFTPAEQLNAYDIPAEPSYEEGSNKKMLFYTQTYNNEKTIARTIESVLNQTQKDDFLYFVVNNGSTDNTGNIIAEFANADPRVVSVVCERNDILGVLLLPHKLFNMVLVDENAYYCIVDGDDAIRESFLDNVLRIEEEFSPDMIVPGFRRIDAASGDVVNERMARTDLLISGPDKADNFYELRALLLCQWGKCYKLKSLRNKANNIFANIRGLLPKWYPGQDTIGVLNRFFLLDKVAFTKEVLYDYYLYPQSAVNTFYPNRYLADVVTLKIYKDFLAYFGPISKLNWDFCYAIYLSLIEYTLNIIINSPVADIKQKFEDIYNMLRDNETKTMLTLDADPEFRNLANRGSFIVTILNYMRGQSVNDDTYFLSGEIMAELVQYKHLITDWED